jgi:hypothetical protein
MQLERKRQTLIDQERCVQASIKPLSMIGRVEALPVQPKLMIDNAASEPPCKSSLVGPIERQRFPLKRGEEIVRTVMIGPSGSRRAAARQRPQYERGSLPANREREHGPNLLKALLRAESLIPEASNREPDTIVQVDHSGDTNRRAKDRFAFAEGIAEFRVVAIEKQLRLHSEVFL